MLTEVGDICERLVCHRFQPSTPAAANRERRFQAAERPFYAAAAGATAAAFLEPHANFIFRCPVVLNDK